MGKRLIVSFLLFAAAIILYAASELAIHYTPGVQLNKPNTEKLERKIETNIAEARKIAEEFLQSVSSKCSTEIFNQGVKYYQDKFELHNFQVFLYSKDTLCFWSSKIDITGIKYDTSRVILQKIQSDYYFTQWLRNGSKKMLVLSHFCSEYPYQNKYLKNEFAKPYRGIEDYRVSLDLVYNGLPVRAKDVNHFYLVPVDSYRRSSFTILKPGIQWTSFLIFVVAIILFFSSNLFRRHVLIRIAGFSLVIIALRALGLIYGIPARPDGVLFGPELFAHSSFNSSLGDFFVNSLLVFILAVFVVRNKKYLARIPKLANSKIVALISATVVFAMFVLVDGMFTSVIRHSTLTLETFKIFNISVYSILAYISISFWVASAMFMLDVWLRVFSVSIKLKRLIIFLIVGLLLVLLISFLLGVFPTMYGLAWISLTSVLFVYFKYSGIAAINLRQFLFVIGILSIYSVTLVSHYSFQKEVDIRRVLSLNLSSERDPVAEVMLTPLYHKLLTDTLVRSYIRDINNKNVELYAHLRKNYFKNYLNRYDLRATVCLPNSKIAVDAINLMDCNRFFNGLINQYGVLLSSSRFFYLNMQNGSISYLGVVGYRYGDELRNLYIELDSRPSWEMLGYPELLIEGRSSQFMLKGYSWAKYHKGILVTQAGDFPYRLRYVPQDTLKKTFEQFNLLGYNHLAYHPNNDDAVIISRPREEALNTTASFVYNLIFFFVLLFAWFKLAGVAIQLKSPNPSFKSRISWAMTLIIMLSLIMVAAATIIYNVRNFEQRNEKNLSEKLLSVMFELNKDISLLYRPNVEYGQLTDRLIDLSNIFYTDINIYDTTGMLMSTSRPEIFEKQLMGRRMNPIAWYEMTYKHSPKFVDKESIGKMTFLSAYVPIVDANNRTIAYLNLPYFTKQEELRTELYSIIIAIINIYALLALFAIATAVLISGQITKPLELIRERISQVNIGRANETIHYSGSDEVGQLIGEYNRMVEELARSAKELARSQRESAWREMAKQIAHEVKNPLTPMKLSLQYLVKAKQAGVPDWDQRFEKFSESLVEQINSLSTIANEFSSFAKLPMANIAPVNLYKLLSDVITLYSGYSNMTFTFTNELDVEPVVLADREQLIRVFNNLVKNAIQSIERGKSGEIGILITNGNDGFVRVEVSDNGIGIPSDILPKLFTPNFTTKSGGTGLGLAITREIVIGFGGNIRVKTEVGVGSTFMVELPISTEQQE